MKKRLISIFLLLITSIVCLSVGVVGCRNTDDAPKAGHIVVRTDSMEQVVAVGSNYTTPIAGAFDSNEDRINGRTILTQVFNPSNKMLEESTEQIKFRFVSTGTWKIKYTAYVNEVKDALIPETTLTVYVCSVLPTPQNFKVENNTLTWDKIDNASGYEVSVNGETSSVVNTESFTSDIFQKSGYYVSVTAKGDNKSYIDSLAAAYRNRTPLKPGELMAFNDPNYELDVTSAVSEGITLPPDEIEWLSEEECKGSTGGAVKLRIRSGNYGWGVFKVLMPEGTTIDMNDDSWKYMEIRFKVDTENYQSNTSFLLNPPNNLNNGYDRGVNVTKDNNDQWYTIQLPWQTIYAEGYKKYTLISSSTAFFDGDRLTWKRNESAYGYQVSITKTAPDGTVTKKTYKNFSSDNAGFIFDKNKEYYSLDISTLDIFEGRDGFTYDGLVECEIPTSYANLNFNFYDMVRTTGKGYVYLDYVRLYTDKIFAPENFRFDTTTNKILWDVVDGADKYTLDIITSDEFGNDSTRYVVAGNVGEFDITSIGIDPATKKFTAKINTIPTDTSKGTSDWTEFEQVLQPVGLSISKEGILSWTAVDNAVSYIVSVNGKEYQAQTTSLNIANEIAKGDVVTFVKAVAKNGYLDGEFSVPCCKLVLNNGQIATFNSPAYQYMISELTKDEQGSTAVGKIASTKYVSETDAEGSFGGAFDIVMSNKAGKGERQRDFKISFANALDFTGYDGISIRFKVYDASTYSYTEDPDVRFRMLTVSGNNYWGTTAYAQPITLNEWVSVRYTKDEVENCLINDGSALSLQFVGYGDFPGLDGGLLKFYLDDISYYKQLAKPTGFALDGNNISWNAVDGADGYVVNVNGTDLSPITTTTMDVGAYLTSSYAFKVKAISNVNIASEYTDSIIKIITSGLNIAEFNNVVYENSVKFLLENTIQPWNNNTIDYTTVKPINEYQTSVDGAENGDAVLIRPIVAHYGSGGSARHAVFTVKLARPLDLTGNSYSGIVIRFKALNVAHGIGGASDADTIDQIQLCNPTTKDKTYTSYNNGTNGYEYPTLNVTEGSWFEWSLTNEQLKTLYSNGATELVFAMIVPGGTSHNYAHPAETYLDYIRYVAK